MSMAQTLRPLDALLLLLSMSACAGAWSDANHKYIISRRTDGLGAQLQAKVSCLLEYSLSRNHTYVHHAFQNVQHGVDNTAIEKWFNLGEGEILESDVPKNVPVITNGGCTCFADFQSQAWPLLSALLLSKYHSPRATPKPTRYKHFNHDMINVAVHLRRGDVSCEEQSMESVNMGIETDGNDVSILMANCSRNGLRNRCVSLNHTVNTVKDVCYTLGNMTSLRVSVTVFTEAIEGQTKNYVLDAFTAALYPQDVHVVEGGNVLEAFHAMVLSDVFIMGHSSFSLTPALYKRTDQVVVYDTFWHGPSPYWTVAGSHGHISEHKGPPAWWRKVTWHKMVQRVKERMQGDM